MAADIPRVSGFASLAGGMESSVDPALLAENQFVRGVNITTRDGLPRMRDGFARVLQFATGTYRGGKVWSLNSGDYLTYVIDGTVYVADIDGATITSLGALFPVATSRCYFCQADQWMVIQDGSDRPVVLQQVGGVFSVYGRNPPEVSLVPGTVMLYSHRRLHYIPKVVPTYDPAVTPATVSNVPIASTIEGRVCIVSSDIRDILNPEWIFRMSEHRVLNGGGGRALPEELGFITALGVLRGAATGTGVGESIVFAREGVCGFDFSFPRTQWDNANLARMLFQGAGTITPEAVTQVNNDLVYIDLNGYVRRLLYDASTLNGSGGNLSNIPASLPMTYYHNLSGVTELAAASATFVDNRYLWTLKGKTGALYDGLGVLDTSASVFTGVNNPMKYDGVWTGFDFQQVVGMKSNGQRRLVIVAKGANDTNYLLMQSPGTYYDNGTTAIRSCVVSRVTNFIEPLKTKELRSVTLDLSDIRTPVVVTVLYRPRGFPTWTSMGTRTINVPGGGPQIRKSVQFVVDTTTVSCDDISEIPLNVADEFQFALQWTGFCRIDRCMEFANAKDKSPSDMCEADNADDSTLPLTENLDDFGYKVTL